MNNSLNRNFTVSCHFTRRWWENFEDVRGVRRHFNITVTIDEFQSEVARRWWWLFLTSQFTFRNLAARITQSGTALPSLGIWWPHVTDIKFWYWQSLVPMLSGWCVCVLGLNTPPTCIQTTLSQSHTTTPHHHIIPPHHHTTPHHTTPHHTDHSTVNRHH